MTTSSPYPAPQETNSLLEELPRWDLTDFYASLKDPKIQEDLSHVQKLVAVFAKDYAQKFTQAEWTGEDLFKAIREYEKIDEILSKLMSYGYLTFATNVNNPPVLQFFQMIQERATTISADLIFFTLELNQIKDDDLKEAYQENVKLVRYKPWIDTIRMFQGHQLSPDLEKLLHEKSITGRNAWVRLYDETLAGAKFPYRDQEIALGKLLNLLGHKEASIRHDAAQALAKGLESHISVLTHVTNTLAKDKEIEDTWRLFPHPIASRNLSNQVEDQVVESLAKTVKENYGHLSHRYYALKAKWLGLEKLEYWDRNAPLPEADDALIPWNKAQEIVLDAYHAFSPEMASIGRRFFENSWIDAPSQNGKESGAFAHPTVPSMHPYLLLNYHGKLRDVMTLAHELGHGIHQVLAADQGCLLASTPLTIAETASVFGEMMTFKALLAQASPHQRRSLLASKVDDMMNTVIRQVAFFEFEEAVHTRRRAGELTTEDIGDIWMKTQKDALGESVNMDSIVRNYWGYVSHFVHAPFYVYAYAFGDCLVNSLYSVYESGYPDFQRLYIDLLKAGGSKRYPELLAPFGLDAKDPQFWQKGLGVIAGFIDELEQMP